LFSGRALKTARSNECRKFLRRRVLPGSGDAGQFPQPRARIPRSEAPSAPAARTLRPPWFSQRRRPEHSLASGSFF